MSEGRLFDGQSAAARAVGLRLEDDALVLVAEDGNEAGRWPLATLVIMDDRQAPVRSGSGADECLTVDDATLFRRLREAVPRRHRVKAPLTTALVILALGLAVLLLLRPAAGLIGQLLPTGIERALGLEERWHWAEALAAREGRQALYCAHEAGQRGLDRLARRLAGALALEETVAIAVLAVDHPNAFALPGGAVLLTRGLLGQLRDGDELAFVLAHELAHIHHRHAMQGLAADALLRWFWAGLVGTGVGLFQDLAPATIGAAHQREAEREADRTALRMLERQGLATTAPRHLLARIAGERGRGLLSSHPASTARIEALGEGRPGATALDGEQWRAIASICAVLRS